MHKALGKILEIQELDVKMIRLMLLKRDRQKELDNIDSIRQDFTRQLEKKKEEILMLKKDISVCELELEEAKEKVKKFESQQGAVKKVDEFNALSKEIASAERERHNKELRLHELGDNLTEEEEKLDALKETMESTLESSQVFEGEIMESIRAINQEGRTLQEERDREAKEADPEVLRIYERLLNNKKERVIVPVENRTCSGCHIVLTAQHENLVRKGERLVFCEHCSRIHYWQDVEAPIEVDGTKRRRRRTTAKAS